MSAADAIARLADQISQADKLATDLASANTVPAVETVTIKYENWHEYNNELLLTMWTVPVWSEEYRRDWPAAINLYPSIETRRFDLAKSIQERQRRLISISNRVGLYAESNQTLITAVLGEAEKRPPAAVDPRAVFVVHGRDERARRGIFTFLRALDLRPLEWSKAIALTGKTTPYVGEVLDAALANAQAILVILSPDDEGRLGAHLCSDDDADYERNLTPQARQNVLFEAGMAMAFAPKRTVLVQLGHVRPFSDIGGRHVLRVDNSQSSRYQLALRLKSAQCALDLDGTEWQDAGDLNTSREGVSVTAPPHSQAKPTEVSGVPANIVLTVSPGSLPADGISSATVSTLIFDSDGEVVDDHSVQWVCTGPASLNPASGATRGGSASTTLVPQRSEEDVTIAVSCFADGGKLSSTIDVACTGIGSEPR